MKGIAGIRFAVTFALFVLFGLSQISATPPSIPKLVIDGQVDIIGEFSPGNEFDIVFKFTLRPEGYLYGLLQSEKTKIELLDETDSATVRWQKVYSESRDTAYIRLNSNIEFLSDNGWSGKILPGSEIVLIVRARLKEKVKTVITAGVKTNCREGYDAYNNKVQTCFTYNTFASKEIYSSYTSSVKSNRVDSLKGGVIIKQVSRMGPLPDTSMRVKKSDSAISEKNSDSKSDKKKSNDKNTSKKSDQANLGASGSPYFVSGNFYYVHVDGDTRPKKNTTIYVFYDQSGWVYDFATQTPSASLRIVKS